MRLFVRFMHKLNIPTFTTDNIPTTVIRSPIQNPNRELQGSYDYISLLQVCASKKALAEGKKVHCHMLINGAQQNGSVGIKLITLYAKCGSLVDARLVFDRYPKPDVFAWTTMIGEYAKQSHCDEALILYYQMQQAGILPDNFVFPSVLKASAGLSSIQHGKSIHGCIIRSGFEVDVFVGSALVDMYAKCGSTADAHQLFNQMCQRDVVSWAAMIGGYAQNGQDDEALKLFCEMQLAGVKPNLITIVSVLPACARVSDLKQGKEIHCYIKECGFESDSFVGSALVDMYAKCGSLDNARQVFDKISQKDVISYNAMVAGYSQNGYDDEAFKLFRLMQLAHMKPDPVTLASVLLACTHLAALQQGKEIHDCMIRSGFDSDIFVLNSLIDMYVKCGSIGMARKVFQKMSQRDVVSWNAIIACYAQNGYSDEAFQLFSQMQLEGIRPNIITWNAMIVGHAQNGQRDEALEHFYQMQLAGVNPNLISWNSIISGYTQNRDGLKALKLFRKMQLAGMKPNAVTIASVLPTCSHLGALQQGKEFHGFIIRNGLALDVFVGSALVDMYAKCRRIDNARLVFNKLSQRDTVSWNAMIAGYAQNGHMDEALKLFHNMQMTGIKLDNISWNAMIAGFAQKGHGDEAMKLFSQMQLAGIKPNVISWNGMISGYAQNGHGHEALRFFHQMQWAGVKPDSITITSVLSACACLAALQQGKSIHDYVIKNGFESTVFVVNALIDMYAKCGSIQDACQAFYSMSERDMVSWNAMISCYAMHGHSKHVIALFHQMQQEDVKPDHITFTGILSACSHAGMVEEGWHYFNGMKQDYCILPRVEHYACMVDLLGRAGHLDEACDLINKMPFEPSSSVWGALLGACRIHCNIELGEHAAEHLFKLEPQNVGIYVLLSNIYASAGRWDDVAKVRKMLDERGLMKRPGCSWIQLHDNLHAFVVGDRSHPQREKIHTMLESLAGQMKEAGYSPERNFALHDVNEEEKEHILCGHSEKLAIAFGLINSCAGAPIRVFKNLRVCIDCHIATKFISKIVKREIIVRDTNRFHHFKDGLCSCGDYW
eukprot:Gb_21401 [translate_table: standard]